MGFLFEPFLKRSGLVVLDGALATELERRGANLNDSLWSARMLSEDPGLIKKVHLDYFRAGADLATTASYQATFEGFSRFGFSELETIKLLQLSVSLACDARDQFCVEHENLPDIYRPLVAASVGSYGAFLADGSEYRGDYNLSIDQLKEFHRMRVEVLLGAAPDLLAFETVPSLREGEALISLISEYPEARAWLSFSCSDGEYVSHGERFRECVELANHSPQIVAVGLNCTSPEFVETLLLGVRDVVEKPLLAYPNSGEGWDAQNRRWTQGSDEYEIGRMARQWHRAGARLIGGCCRTTPDDISRIVAEFGPDSHSTRDGGEVR